MKLILSFMLVMLVYLLKVSCVMYSSKVLTDGMIVDVSLPSTKQIQFKITYFSYLNVEFMFNPVPFSSDGFLLYKNPNNGQWATIDKRWEFEVYGCSDTISHYSMSYTENGNLSTFTVKRNLVTDDYEKHDIPINDGRNQINVNTENSSDYIHRPLDIFYIDVHSKYKKVFIEGGVHNYHTTSLALHAVFLYLWWGWTPLLLIITGRYLKHYYKFRMIVHVAVALIVGVFTLIGALSFSDRDSSNFPIADSLSLNHKKLGKAALYWMTASFAFGILNKLWDLLLKYNVVVANLVKFCHAFVSYSLIAFTQIVMLSGLYYANYPVATGLFYAHWVLMLLTAVIFEIIFRLWKKRSINLLSCLEQKMLPEMTLEDFLVSDQKLVLYQNFVLNVSKFWFDHPGGRRIFEDLDKNDIWMFLHEKHFANDSRHLHTHSYVAFKIIEKIAVARLARSTIPRALWENDVNKKDLENSKDELDSLSTDRFFGLPKDEVFNAKCKIRDISLLFENVYKITFENAKLTAITKNVGLRHAGRKIMISSVSNQNCKYSTLCSCLNSNTYDTYMLQIDAIMKLVGERSNHDLKTSPESDIIEIYVKNDAKNKCKIDKELINAKLKDEFYVVDSPLSKGLSISKETISKGSTLIFTEGIGILQFLDLFAYFCRKLINKESPRNTIFDDEVFDDCIQDARFIVYAYFPNEKESIGLDFCRKIDKLHKMFGAKNIFKFTPMFIDTKGKAFDYERIKRLIYRHSLKRRVQNIWVSGSNSLTSLFNKQRDRILKLTEGHALIKIF